MSQVEPVLAPPLAILRTGEQPIDQSFISVGPAVVDERATSSGEGGKP